MNNDQAQFRREVAPTTQWSPEEFQWLQRRWDFARELAPNIIMRIDGVLVPSSTNPGEFHLVAKNITTCTCPDWRSGRTHYWCKHRLAAWIALTPRACRRCGVQMKEHERLCSPW